MLKKKIDKKFSFCFCTRSGGTSKGNFFSLNCAFKKGDSKKNVEKNREIAKSYINSKKKIILLNQVHSNRVVFIDNKKKIPAYGDGMVTNRNDILLGILTADCAPIIILGKKNFGIIHAGWKGTILGIIENTVKMFINSGDLIQDLVFLVGPHLKKKSFHIKKDFIEVLKKNHTDYLKLIHYKDNSIFFDFSKFIEFKLQKLNVLNYSISNQDTFSNPKKFFSHRYYKNQGIENCGRQISLVGIKDN